MSENMCPLCGGELMDMGMEWGCQSTMARGASRDGCGARGRYNERGEPVANEPDSARLDEMCGRLIDAMRASSDRGRVGCLVGHYVSLRMWLANGWHECDEGEPLWLYGSGQAAGFEGDMKDAKVALSETCACGQSRLRQPVRNPASRFLAASWPDRAALRAALGSFPDRRPCDEGLCPDCRAEASEVSMNRGVMRLEAFCEALDDVLRTRLRVRE